jgi:hypothetical protein
VFCSQLKIKNAVLYLLDDNFKDFWFLPINPYRQWPFLVCQKSFEEATMHNQIALEAVNDLIPKIINHRSLRVQH